MIELSLEQHDAMEAAGEEGQVDAVVPALMPAEARNLVVMAQVVGKFGLEVGENVLGVHAAHLTTDGVVV